MNRLKNLVILSGLIMMSLNGHSQTVNYDQALGLPTVTPPSPDAAAIEKFGNIPVSYSTGVPDISIPLWTIQCEKLKWPVSLSYNASGIKVDELASGAGLGWALNGPGVISRAVQGLPDELGVSTVMYDTITLSDWQWCYSALAGYQDIAPDIMSFNFNGRSGKFYVNADSSIFQVPYSDLKIVMNGNFTSFTITDESGVTYLFDQQESTYTSNAQSGKTSNYVSSWYLSKVMMPDQKDSITFSYASGGGSTQFFENFSQAIGQSYQGSTTLSNLYGSIQTSQTEVQTTFLKLTQINYPNGNISVNYDSGYRTDIPQANNQISNVLISRQTGNVTAPLQKWIFYQSYFFYQPPGTSSSYNDYRLRLDSVYEYGNDNALLPETYQFTYNTTPMVPSGSYGQDLWGFNNGQYDNPTLLQSVWVPNFDYNNFSVGNANRIPDSVQMQACMLTAIRYPTGGRTTFSYSPNYYPPGPSTSSLYTVPPWTCSASSDGNWSHVVGLRYPAGAQSPVLTVSLPGLSNDMKERPTVFLVDITTGTTIYSYFQNSSQPYSVTVDPGLEPGDSLQLQANVYPIDSNQVDMTAIIDLEYNTDSVVNPVDYGGGLRIATINNYTDSNTLATQENYYYDTATTLTPSNYVLQQYASVIYRWGDAELSTPSCVYWYSPLCRVYTTGSVYPVATFMGSPMIYQKVTKVTTDPTTGINNGMSVYTYDIIPDEADAQTDGIGLTNTPMISNEWEDGFLTSETDYKLKNGTYSILKQSVNSYYEYKLSQTYGLSVYANNIVSGCDPQDYINVYYDVGLATVPITTGAKKLIQNTETLYDDNGNSIVTVTNNQYNDSTNDFLTQTALTDSKGNTQLTTFKYPQDTATAGSVYAEMVQENIIGPVIKQQTFNDSVLQSTIVTAYQDWNGDGKVIAPQIIQASILNNPLENRVQYYGYDSFRNILSVAKVGDAVHSYIWDYRHTVPIAQVTNAALSDIAYTSFEADGSGGWTVGTGTVDTTTAITGTNSYNLSSGSTISASGLNSSTTYIVSYWTMNHSAFNISGTISGYPLQGKTEIINGKCWTLYVHKVTGQSTIIVSGSGHIDELRLYPSTAQMTTYTYSPLVGMTSQTDVGNRVTYYEYDGLARLQRVRDQDYNILKTYEYQYQVPAGCNGCQTLAMETFLGTNTIGYPVGVFDIHGNLVGNAAGASAYVSLWNSDTADARVGTLSTGNDSLHFNIVLNAGQTLPASVTGCRYYQYDLPWYQLDGVRYSNGTYVDFGDGTGMHLGTGLLDTPKVMAPNTTFVIISDYYYYEGYLIHTYSDNDNDTSVKTITFYHNDDNANSALDNAISPATSLLKVRNLRGNLPQNTNEIGGSSYQQPSALTVSGISNWSSITSVHYFDLQNGDRINNVNHVNYAQDFMQNNKGLDSIYTEECADTTFKLSLLKSNWNTWFTNLYALEILDNQWNRDDISGLTNLKYFFLVSASTNGLGTNGIPVLDNIINQIAAGGGKYQIGGVINISWPGFMPTSASQYAVQFLKSKEWTVFINGVTE